MLVDADMGKIAFFCNGVLQRWVSGLDCRAGTDMYREHINKRRRSSGSLASTAVQVPICTDM